MKPVTIIVLFSLLVGASVQASDFTSLANYACHSEHYMKTLLDYCGKAHPKLRKHANRAYGDWIKINKKTAATVGKMCQQVHALEQKYDTCHSEKAKAVSSAVLEQRIDNLRKEGIQACKTQILQVVTVNATGKPDTILQEMINDKRKLATTLKLREKQLKKAHENTHGSKPVSTKQSANK